MSQVNAPANFEQSNDTRHVLHVVWDVISFSRLGLYTSLVVAMFLSLGSRIVEFLISIGVDQEPFTNANTFFKDISDSVDKRVTVTSSFGTGLLWFAVGSVLYVLFWVLIVVIIDGYNDVVVSFSFVHPNSFHQSSYWFAIVGRFLVRFSAICLFFFILSRIITVGVSKAYVASSTVWTNGALSVLYFGLLFAAIVACLQTCIVLARLSFFKRRLLG